MTTLQSFYEVLSQYDKNAGWGRCAANWASWGAKSIVGYGVPGGRAASMTELFNYYEEIKNGSQPSEELKTFQVENIRKIILKHLPKELGGSQEMSAEDFLKFPYANYKILANLTKLLSLPEYWRMAMVSVSAQQKTELAESRVATQEDLVFDTDLAQNFGAQLSMYQIYNQRVLQNKQAYRNPQAWMRGHCYDMTYPNYHANRIGSSNVILAHGPATTDSGEGSVMNFIDQLIFSTAPVIRILAIGTPKNDRLQTNADFIDYLRSGEIPGSTAENKITVTVTEHEAFKKQYGELSPNLLQYNLSCQKNNEVKTVEVLLLRVKTMSGLNVLPNAKHDLDQLSPQMMKVIQEFVEEAGGNVAIHCHDGITQSSSLLLSLELMKEPHRYFSPQLATAEIQKWIGEMRQQSTRAFVPTKALLYDAICNALMTLPGAAEHISSPSLGNGFRRQSTVTSVKY